MSRPVLGIVGGGQLARMTAQAALSLAVEVQVLASDPGDSACAAASRVMIGDPGDRAVLDRFSRTCDVLTFDHEQVDPGLVAELESAGRTVRPGAGVLRFADKAYQRTELAVRGLPVPAARVGSTALDIEAFATDHGWPVVVKTATGGYDGRGVFVVEDPSEARHTVEMLQGRRLVLEPMLAIERELAVIVARRPSGQMLAYPVVETTQIDGICVETVAPAMIDPRQAIEVTHLALSIAETVAAVGILAVEFFVTPAGIVINELAPRPHNSGHWTIEGAVTSQFENHIRGVLDWPLGDTGLTAPAVATANVLGATGPGDPIDRLPEALGIKGAHVHLYAKALRSGRKLGHVTARGPDPGSALTRARGAAAALGSAPVPVSTGGSPQ